MENNTHNYTGAWLGLGAVSALVLIVCAIIIGADTLRTLATILVVAVALLFISAGASRIIKAWRTPVQAPPIVQEHYYHDGTRTIERHTLDGRTSEGSVRLLQLPGAQQPAGFPELMRAAYAAGANGHAASFPQGLGAGLGARSEQTIDQLAEQPFEDAPDSYWHGDITP